MFYTFAATKYTTLQPRGHWTSIENVPASVLLLLLLPYHHMYSRPTRIALNHTSYDPVWGNFKMYFKCIYIHPRSWCWSEYRGDIPWIFDFALVTLKKLASHISVISFHFLLSSVFILHISIFPEFHFFTVKNWLLSLFTLATVNMVSPNTVSMIWTGQWMANDILRVSEWTQPSHKIPSGCGNDIDLIIIYRLLLW